MPGPYSRFPRIYLDIEAYRPPTKYGRAGFFSHKTRLIGYAAAVETSESTVKYYVDIAHDEKRLLRNIDTLLSRYARRSRDKPLLVGYNILIFDIPFISYRAHRLLEHREARRLHDNLYRGFLVIDLFQLALYLYSGDDLPSFQSFYDAIASRQGGPAMNKDGTGYSIHELYERGDLGSIKEYSRREIRMLVELYRMITNGIRRDRSLGDKWGILDVILKT